MSALKRASRILDCLPSIKDNELQLVPHHFIPPAARHFRYACRDQHYQLETQIAVSLPIDTTYEYCQKRKTASCKIKLVAVTEIVSFANVVSRLLSLAIFQYRKSSIDRKQKTEEHRRHLDGDSSDHEVVTGVEQTLIGRSR